nr:carbohydrate-binding family 9-like protein [uncultured Chitinophaga sp.]
MRQLLCTLTLCVACLLTQAQSVLKVRNTPDFTITGAGTDANWNKTSWITLSQRSGDVPAKTQVKALYSGKGIYFLFHCEDKRLSNTMQADMLDLWKEDVVEAFLWPDTTQPAYFEYELSPLNYELVLLISNQQNDLAGWQPFHYGEDRRTLHATAIQGGEKKGGATVNGWTAEFFIPYKLLRPLNNAHPTAGTVWKANFYRVDYDKGSAEWCWQLTGPSFHDLPHFGWLHFE